MANKVYRNVKLSNEDYRVWKVLWNELVQCFVTCTFCRHLYCRFYGKKNVSGLCNYTLEKLYTKVINVTKSL